MNTIKSIRTALFFCLFALSAVISTAQAQSPSLEDLAALKNITSSFVNTQSFDNKTLEIGQWYSNLSNQAKTEIAKVGITSINVVEKLSMMPPFVQHKLIQLGMSNEQAMLQLILQFSGQANTIINQTDTNASQLLNSLLGIRN